jgi:hypothetical protein
MQYFFKNIAQNNLMRTIILVLLGLVIWILSLLKGNDLLSVFVGTILVSVNSLLAMHCCYKMGWSNLPSGLVAATMWVTLSSISVYNICWQVHLFVMALLLGCILVIKTHNQEEAKEQAFLITLICCMFSPKIIIAGVAIVVLLVALMLRSHMTWRVLMSSVVAILVYLLYAYVLRQLGWLDVLWKENWPILPTYWWIIVACIYTLNGLTLYLIFNRSSVANGVIFLSYLSVTIVFGIGCYINVISDYMNGLGILFTS